MASVWPASLPQLPRRDAFAESGDGVVIRSAVDAGPPILRQRYTKELARASISLTMTDAQVSTFRTFFNTTLSRGSLAFEWDNFVDSGTIEYTFASRPNYTPLAFGYWRVEFSLETML